MIHFQPHGIKEVKIAANRRAGLASALPHVAPDRANLLVLAELLGLPAALIGPRRGAPARRAHSSQTALILLTLDNWPQLLTVRRRWKGISIISSYDQVGLS